MTISFGIKAAHEQFDPQALLEHCTFAERMGINSTWASDHFHPWSHTNAQAGFAWVWMASLAERTKSLTIGTGVTAPTFRYHPALVAQAFATLGNLYPGRIRLGVGTGEALNEMPFGYDWPSLRERVDRLLEAIKIIRMMWQGDFVNYAGKYYNARNAKIYTKPKQKIPIFMAGFGPKTSYLAGKHADGYYSFLSKPADYFKNTIFPQVRRGAEDAGKNFDDLGSSVEMMFSYDDDYDQAVQSARFWAGSFLPVFFKYGIADPIEIEENGRKVGLEAIKQSCVISTKPDEIIARAAECYEAGFKEVVFMSSSPNQLKAIEMLGRRVLPYLKDNYREGLR